MARPRLTWQERVRNEAIRKANNEWLKEQRLIKKIELQNYKKQVELEEKSRLARQQAKEQVKGKYTETGYSQVASDQYYAQSQDFTKFKQQLAGDNLAGVNQIVDSSARGVKKGYSKFSKYLSKKPNKKDSWAKGFSKQFSQIAKVIPKQRIVSRPVVDVRQIIAQQQQRQQQPQRRNFFEHGSELEVYGDEGLTFFDSEKRSRGRTGSLFGI